MKRALLLVAVFAACAPNEASKRPEVAAKETAETPCPEPGRASADEQLFRDAMAAGGEAPEEAVKHYWELIKRHPTSRHAPIAWLQLGEFFLTRGEQAKATQAFKKAMETSKPLVAQVATLRLATLGEAGDAAAARERCLALLENKNCWASSELLESWRAICSDAL